MRQVKIFFSLAYIQNTRFVFVSEFLYYYVRFTIHTRAGEVGVKGGQLNMRVPLFELKKFIHLLISQNRTFGFSLKLASAYVP